MEKIKLVPTKKESKGISLCNLGLCNGFLDRTTKAKVAKDKINSTSSQLKTFGPGVTTTQLLSGTVVIYLHPYSLPPKRMPSSPLTH